VTDEAFQETSGRKCLSVEKPAAYWDARKNLLVSVPNAQTFIVMNISIRITTTGMLKQNKAFILVDLAEITSDHTYSLLIVVLRK
jgi:hypothetical protein